MSRYCIVLALSALAAGSMACNDVTAPTLVGGITIVPTDTSTLLLGPGGGQRVQFTAHTESRNGTASALSNVVWRTSAPDVLSVNESGMVSALALGSAIVIARVGATLDSAWVMVRPVPVASLVIALDSIALQIGPYGGSVRTLSAVMRDSVGRRLTAREVRWSGSDAAIATVTLQGIVTAIGEGETWVHASVDAQHDSARVIVTPTLGPASGVEVRILDAQWTQGVQRSDGSIPMLSGGRAAVVNVTTTATGAIATPTQFVLRLFNSRGVPVHADTTSVSILSGVTTVREPTLQFLVPAELLRAGLRWDLIRDPDQLSPGGADGAEALPATGHELLPLVSPPPLRIRFVPIVLSAHGESRGAVTTALLDYYLRNVRAFFPHGRIDATIGPAHRTAVRFGIAGYGGDAAFWSAVVAELDTRRIADPEFADAHWIGVVRPPAGFTYTSFGGMGFVPADGQSFGPGTRTSAVIGANWFYDETRSRDLVAHELGHNLGRMHAPCGTSGFVDASFPDARGAIGEGAHDTFSWELGLAASARAVSGGTADFMGYCSPAWISAHTYGGMLEFRDSPTLALRELGVRQRVLLVRGTVDAGVAHLDAPVTIAAMPSDPEPGGEWMLEGVAEGGAVIFRWPFSLARWDHAGEAQPFAIAMPFDAATEQRLVKVRVSGASTSVEWRLR